MVTPKFLCRGYSLAYSLNASGDYIFLVGIGEGTHIVSADIVLAIIDDATVCNASDIAEHIDNTMADGDAYGIQFTFRVVDWNEKQERRRVEFLDNIVPSDIGDYIARELPEEWVNERFINRRARDRARRHAVAFT